MTRSMTRISSLFAALVALTAVLFARGVPTDYPSSGAREVFSPTKLIPNNQTVWPACSRQNVTWSLANTFPEILDNGLFLTFAKDHLMFINETGGLNNPLADNFTVRAGHVEFTVPDVDPGTDYNVVLFGDSGNFSPNFTITEPGPEGCPLFLELMSELSNDRVLPLGASI